MDHDHMENAPTQVAIMYYIGRITGHLDKARQFIEEQELTMADRKIADALDYLKRLEKKWVKSQERGE